MAVIASKPGLRLRSAVCATEVVMVKAPGADVDLQCGGAPMVAIDEAPADSGTPASGFDGGTLIGKRYVDAAESIELLCTKAGAGALSLGEELLVTKGAKPLPSSD
jgi:hypothetical protein